MSDLQAKIDAARKAVDEYRPHYVAARTRWEASLAEWHAAKNQMTELQFQLANLVLESHGMTMRMEPRESTP